MSGLTDRIDNLDSHVGPELKAILKILAGEETPPSETPP